MKKLSSHMGPFSKWLNRWKLRRIIVALEAQVNEGANDHVMGFAKSLEATEIMSRGCKKHDMVTISCERTQLNAFIRYMCSLHDSKLSRIMLARIGLATLMTRDEKTLGQPAKQVIEDEIKRSGESRSVIEKAADKQMRLPL